MTPRPADCVACGGHGDLRDLVRDSAYRDEPAYRPCRVCGGTGELPWCAICAGRRWVHEPVEGDRPHWSWDAQWCACVDGGLLQRLGAEGVMLGDLHAEGCGCDLMRDGPRSSGPVEPGTLGSQPRAGAHLRGAALN